MVQKTLGSTRAHKLLVKDYIRPRSNMSVLDIGCGPADVLEYFSVDRYIGIDLNPAYVATAERRFGDKGKFLVGDAAGIEVSESEKFDRVLALGLLHHLDDDEVRILAKSARRLLAAGGKFVSADPCYIPGQNPLARYLISKDKGRSIRALEAYRELLSPYFPKVTSSLRDDFLRVPYNHCIFECEIE
jgi:SAM-dependent methyltransferase